MDAQLLYLLNRAWTAPWLDWLMAVASAFALWKIPLLLLAVLVFVGGGFRARAMILCLAVAVGIADGVVAQPLKKAVGRPRPHEVLADVRQVELRRVDQLLTPGKRGLKVRRSRPEPGPVRGTAFPSSHTANTFCAATVLLAFFRRWGVLALGLAMLVGWSRVYTGSHWPSDVLLSIPLGIGVGLLVLAGLETLWRLAGPRWMPAIFAQHPTLLGRPEPVRKKGSP